MKQALMWVRRLALPLALLGYFVWLAYRDGDPTRPIAFVAIYCAAGVLTAVAVALICRNERSDTVPKDARGGGTAFRPILMVLAVWPWVILMGIIFAILMLGQRRQNRMPARESSASSVNRPEN